MVNYREEAASDANGIAWTYLDVIAEALARDGRASHNLPNDYPNEGHYDIMQYQDEVSLPEATAILDEFREFESLEPNITQWGPSIRASDTFFTAVHVAFEDVIKKINDAWDEDDIDPDSIWAREYSEDFVKAVLYDNPLPAKPAKEWRPRKKR